MKKYILIVLIFNFLQSCSSVSEGFKLKKGNTGDEFLVEKKSPLVMPPDYNELPIPKEKIEQTDINENEFKTLITQKNQDTKSDSNEDVNKNFEEFLLDKIKKN